MSTAVKRACERQEAHNTVPPKRSPRSEISWAVKMREKGREPKNTATTGTEANNTPWARDMERPGNNLGTD